MTLQGQIKPYLYVDGINKYNKRGEVVGITTNEDLRQLFIDKDIIPTHVDISTTDEGQHLRGFGFVEFAHGDDAQKAKDLLDEQTIRLGRYKFHIRILSSKKSLVDVLNESKPDIYAPVDDA